MKGMDDLLNMGGFDNEKELLSFVEIQMKAASNIWKEMYSAGFFETFGELVNNEKTIMDAYCYYIVVQNTDKGSIIDMPYMPGLVPEEVRDELKDTSLEVSSLLMSSVSLRAMMLSAMMYGVWWKANLDKLDKLWNNGAIEDESSS